MALTRADSEGVRAAAGDRRHGIWSRFRRAASHWQAGCTDALSGAVLPHWQLAGALQAKLSSRAAPICRRRPGGAAAGGAARPAIIPDHDGPQAQADERAPLLPADLSAFGLRSACYWQIMPTPWPGGAPPGRGPPPGFSAHYLRERRMFGRLLSDFTEKRRLKIRFANVQQIPCAHSDQWL